MSWGHPGYFTLGVWNMWLKSDRRNYNPKIIKDGGYPWCRVVYYTHHCNHNLPGMTLARKPWDVLSPADYAWAQRTISSKHWIKITCMHVCLGSDFWSYVQNHASLQEINKKKKIIKTKKSCECFSITTQYVIFITHIHLHIFHWVCLYQYVY